MTRWLIAGGLLYKGVFKEMAVMIVCTDLYVCGYVNAMDDMSKKTKKPFLRNIANMAQTTTIGMAKAVIFPVYIPLTAVSLLFYSLRH